MPTHWISCDVESLLDRHDTESAPHRRRPAHSGAEGMAPHGTDLPCSAAWRARSTLLRDSSKQIGVATSLDSAAWSATSSCESGCSRNASPNWSVRNPEPPSVASVCFLLE